MSLGVAKKNQESRYWRALSLTMVLLLGGATGMAEAGPRAAMPGAHPAGENGRREVVFIDSSLVNSQALASGIGAGIDVELIDRESDGLAQMARWARSHRGYDAIHVLSHGASGRIRLGAEILDDAALNRSEVRAQLARIGQALRGGGDLFLYGCRVAGGARGRSFVQNVAAATGAHVAASTDPTGSARLGGNWALEYATAENSASPLAEPDYDALLGAGTITFNTDNGTTFGADGIVTDGEGGSSDITDIVIQVAAIDGSSAILTGDHLAFHSDDWPVPAIVTWDNGGAGSRGMVIKSSDGTNFKLTSFNFYDWGSWDAATWIVEGFAGGDSVATATLTGNTDAVYVAVNLDATFQNVDEVRIHRQDGAEEWIGLNDIVIADAIPSPTTTIATAQLSDDTGFDASDWITSTALQSINGTLSANLVVGEKVQVSYDNGTTWSDASSMVGSNTWSAGATLSGSGTFKARVFKDAGGPSYSQPYVVDTTGPTVASVTRLSPAGAVTNADTLVFQVTFGEALANLRNASTGDFAVSGTTATVASVNTADVDSYDVTISGGNLASLNGTVTLSFSGAQNIVDLAGNALNTTVTGTNNNTYTLDNTGPTISSIVRQTPASAVTNANSVVFRVTFGETVSNVTDVDFAATGTTATPSVSAVAGDTYDVTLSGGNLAALDGTVSLGLAGGQDIADTLGNVLTNTTPTGLSESYTLDNTDPGGCAGALSVAENAANGTAVGTVTASDTHSVTYALTDTAGGRFAISAGGAVTVANGSLLDYESATSHSITIRATDAAGNISDTIRDVSITNANDIAPVITEGAGPLAVTMSEDSTPTAFAQALNATDADGATTYTWTISAAASHGTASTSGNNPTSITYVPTANYNGSDHFTVQVSDGVNIDSIHIDVTIAAVNDAPIINQGDSTSFSTAEDTSYDLTLGGTDVEGQPLSWTLTAAPAHGGVGFAGGTAASKTFTYTPAANFNGSDQFTVRVSDGTATDSITVNVTVTAANDAPVITEGAVTSFTTAEETAHGVNLTVTDIDAGDVISWSVSSAPAHGTATVPAGTGTSKSVTYTPAANYNGSDSFVVAASDGTASDTITVNVTVTAVDDAPIINEGASISVSTRKGTSYALTLTGTEVDGQSLEWSLSSAPGHGDVTFPAGAADSKTFTYTPAADYSGSDSFEVTLSDGALTDTSTVNVNVTAISPGMPTRVFGGGGGALGFGGLFVLAMAALRRRFTW